MTNEWLNENVINTFELNRSGNRFSLSSHPVDTEMDLTHYCGIDHPALVLRLRFNDKSRVLFLSGSATEEEIRAYAEEMADSTAKRISNDLVKSFQGE